MQKNTLIVLAGPTASGKTALSIDLARELNCEIISADSRQFYKEMNIGTAKPGPEEMQGIPHHFLDFLSIHEEYNAGLFEKDVLKFLNEYFKRNNIALMVGGSGFYIQAVTEGMDKVPSSDKYIREKLQEDLQTKGLNYLLEKLKILDKDYFATVDRKNPHRIIRALEVCMISGLPYSSFRKKEFSQTAPVDLRRNFNIIKLAIDLPREVLYERINSRVDEMISRGLVEEARQLLPYKHLNALQTVGYVELFEYFENKISLERAIELIKRNTRRYAKRQLTWFRSDPEFRWFHPGELKKIIPEIALSPDFKF